MGLTMKEKGNGKSYDPVPADLHIGICYAVVDLGTQCNPWREGEDKHQVLIIWELPDLRIDVERDGITQNLPRAISKRYTASFHEKANLRKDLQKWRGRPFTTDELKGFHLSKLLGVNCTLLVQHKVSKSTGNTYAMVDTVMPLKGVDKREPENPVVYYDMDEHGKALPKGLPDWVIDVIQESKEWQKTDNPWKDESKESKPQQSDGMPF